MTKVSRDPGHHGAELIRYFSPAQLIPLGLAGQHAHPRFFRAPASLLSLETLLILRKDSAPFSRLSWSDRDRARANRRIGRGDDPSPARFCTVFVYTSEDMPKRLYVALTHLDHHVKAAINEWDRVVDRMPND